MLGDHSQALSDYEQAIQIDPNSVEAYINRAIVYANIGEYEKARHDFKAALALGLPPDDTMYGLYDPGGKRIGVCFGRRGRGFQDWGVG